MIAQSFTHRALRRIWRPIHKTLVPRLVRNGASPGPRTILIQLTYTCNLRCWFCNQWGSTGVYHSLPAAELRQMLPLSVLQRVVDDLPWSCEGVELWDGAEKVKARVEQLRAAPEYKDFIQWENGWGPEHLFGYYSDPTYTAPSHRACRFPWNSVCIYPNGDLSPCPDFPDYMVGNVTRDSFSQIWNGESFRQFRKVLAEKGRFPICSICCHLYDE